MTELKEGDKVWILVDYLDLPDPVLIEARLLRKRNMDWICVAPYYSPHIGIPCTEETHLRDPEHIFRTIDEALDRAAKDYIDRIKMASNNWWDEQAIRKFRHENYAKEIEKEVLNGKESEVR